MELFRLRPVPERLDHPDWAASVYRGECFVLAATERDARAAAAAAFVIATEVKPGVEPPLQPWRQRELVAVTVMEGLGDEPPPGVVMVPARAGVPASGLRRYEG